jgi:hypothetical protein
VLVLESQPEPATDRAPEPERAPVAGGHRVTRLPESEPVERVIEP